MSWYAPLAEKQEKIAIGLMSGTSLDGIDAAMVRIRGYGSNTSIELLGYTCLPFTEALRNDILAACSPDTGRVDLICKLNVQLGEKFAEAARLVAKTYSIPWESVDFISSHGQTIYHMPESFATLQIGELAVIAANSEKVVVGDFRPHDMAVGGQGAPLVPYVDYLLLRDEHRGRVALNIGGIGNISVIPPNAKSADVFAYDTGPGNMIIDAFVRFGTNGKEAYDAGGAYAREGKVDPEWLETLLAHSYYSAPTPKSTGREMFGDEYARALWKEADDRKLSFSDRIATLTALTAYSIAACILKEGQKGMPIHDVVVAGGGQHNQTLMGMLVDRLPGVRVQRLEDYGISSDAKEAIAFVILGNDCIHRVPNQLPSATGARRPIVMGKVVLP